MSFEVWGFGLGISVGLRRGLRFRVLWFGGFGVWPVLGVYGVSMKATS